MENNEFDELLRKAVAKRCNTRMPAGMEARVRQKFNSRRHISWGWIASVAAVIAAVIVVPNVSNQNNHLDSNKRQVNTPSFFVEAGDKTELRLENSFVASGQLRSNIDEFYIKYQQ